MGRVNRVSFRCADDPDGVGEWDDAEEWVAGDREGDDEYVEDQVDAELEADAVFDRDGEGWEDEGEKDEEDGGHGGHSGCLRTCRSRGRHMHGTRLLDQSRS